MCWRLSLEAGTGDAAGGGVLSCRRKALGRAWAQGAQGEVQQPPSAPACKGSSRKTSLETTWWGFALLRGEGAAVAGSHTLCSFQMSLLIKATGRKP